MPQSQKQKQEDHYISQQNSRGSSCYQSPPVSRGNRNENQKLIIAFTFTLLNTNRCLKFLLYPFVLGKFDPSGECQYDFLRRTNYKIFGIFRQYLIIIKKRKRKWSNLCKTRIYYGHIMQQIMIMMIYTLNYEKKTELVTVGLSIRISQLILLIIQQQQNYHLQHEKQLTLIYLILTQKEIT